MKKPRAFQPIADSLELESRRLLSAAAMPAAANHVALVANVQAARTQLRLEQLTARENAQSAQQARLSAAAAARAERASAAVALRAAKANAMAPIHAAAVTSAPVRANLSAPAMLNFGRRVVGLPAGGVFQTGGTATRNATLFTTATARPVNTAALATIVARAAALANPVVASPTFLTPLDVQSGLAFNAAILQSPALAQANPGFGTQTGLIFNFPTTAPPAVAQSSPAFGAQTGLVFNNGLGTSIPSLQSPLALSAQTGTIFTFPTAASPAVAQSSPAFGALTGLIFNNGLGSSIPVSTMFGNTILPGTNAVITNTSTVGGVAGLMGNATSTPGQIFF